MNLFLRPATRGLDHTFIQKLPTIGLAQCLSAMQRNNMARHPHRSPIMPTSYILPQLRTSHSKPQSQVHMTPLTAEIHARLSKRHPHNPHQHQHQHQHHRRRRRWPRYVARGSLAFLVVGFTSGTVAITILMLQSATEPMTVMDAAGIAVAGILRSSISLGVGAVIAAKYQYLFSQFEDYKSDEYKAARSLVHKDAAEWMLWLARTQGGIYVKAGQYIGSLTYIAPQEFASTLSVLQDRAPYRPFSVMSKVLKSELEINDVSDAFAEFDTTPIAAASLAQVHKATTKDGQVVAVKIQYPDVARLLEIDTGTMKLLSDLASYSFKDFSFGWVVAEFKKALKAEFDFQNEARNCEVTHERFKHRRAAIRCPVIRWDMTTRRVLTMEFVEGVKVNSVDGLKALGLDPKDVATLVCEAFAEMIFIHGHVHCDPHAGNMLVVRSPKNPRKPQLVLLDHGLYRTLDEKFRILYCNLWKAMLTGDAKLLQQVSEELGAGEFGKHFPLMFTGRALNSATPLGSTMTKEERQKIRENMKDVKVGDFFSFLEGLPRDMMFAVRVGNLVRAIFTDLGGNNLDRFWINAKYAVKGAWIVKSVVEEGELLQRVAAKRDVASLTVLGGLGGSIVANEVGSARDGYDGLSLRRPLSLSTGVYPLTRVVSFLRDYIIVGLRVLIGQLSWRVISLFR